MLDGQLTAESFDNYSDMTLVAVWEQNLSEYTVTYDANGGTFSDGTGSRSETSESTIYAISDQIPTLDGYRFTGWQLNGANVSGTIQATGENLTLTAQWIQRVTLTYDGNGGTFSGGSTTATSTYDINTSHGFWTTGPIKSGALFDGWQYEDGSRVGTRITQTDALTVYAIWVTESTITLDAGEGTFADGSSQKTVTVAVDGTYWPNETPELSGYVFDGWLNRDQYGTPVGFVAATQARITLIASWIEDYAVRPDSVTITADQDSVMYEYDCYGPGMGGASMSLTSSVEGTSINDPYSLYYHWQVSEDQSTWSSVYDEYGTVNTGTGFTSCTAWFDYEGIRYFRVLVNGVCSNVVRVNVTSDWDDIPNVLTYDANGGMFGNGSIVRSTVISYYYSQTTLDTYEPPRRFGYSFQGWTLDGVLVESIVVEGDVTVYASWTEIEPEPEPATYTVTYYANGGAFPGGATSMSGVLTDDYIQENGSYVGDLGDSGWVATPEREGYEFRGWSEDPDWVEGDMAYDDGSLNSDHYPDGMAITGDVSLYACWVAEEPQRTLSVTMDDVTQSAGMGAAFFAVASWSDGTEVTGAGYRWYTLNDGNWVEISGTHGLTTYYVATTIDMNGKRYKVVVTCDGQEASAEATLMVGYRVLYDAYYGEFPGDVGRYIDIIVTEGGCNVGDLGNGNTVPDPTREGYEFGGWYDAYFQVEYEMGSWIEVNDNITLFAYWPAPAPEPEDLTVTIWADSEYLTVLEGNPEDSDNLHIWSSVEGVTGDLTYQWQQKTWWNDDFVDTWSMGDDETTFYLNGTSVEDGTTYRLVVNGIPSNEITIGVYHEYPQDVCPECGGTDGSHYEWCSLMGGVNDEWWCDICGTFHQYGEDCPNA